MSVIARGRPKNPESLFNTDRKAYYREKMKKTKKTFYIFELLGKEFAFSNEQLKKRKIVGICNLPKNCIFVS